MGAHSWVSVRVDCDSKLPTTVEDCERLPSSANSRCVTVMASASIKPLISIDFLTKLQARKGDHHTKASCHLRYWILLIRCLILHITTVLRRWVRPTRARRKLVAYRPRAVGGGICEIPFVQFSTMLRVDGAPVLRPRTFAVAVVLNLGLVVSVLAV